MSNNLQKVRVVKLFASSEYKIRNKAYKTIKYLLKLEFGNDKKQLSENDILAIWKGLYVWLWMQDKPILHEEVVEKISALLPMILSEKLAFEFIRGFFITLNREWPKLDAHRLDKYYMLVRDMLNTSLKWLQAKEWKYLNEWFEILQKIVLVPSNTSAMGLKLHFLDIILDELVKINAESAVVTRTVTEIILSLRAAGVNNQTIYFSKLSKRVIDRIVPMRNKDSLNIDILQLSESLQSAAASKQQTNGKTRKLFYKLAERFKQESNKIIPNSEESMETDEMQSSVTMTTTTTTIRGSAEENSASEDLDEAEETMRNEEEPLDEAMDTANEEPHEETAANEEPHEETAANEEPHEETAANEEPHEETAANEEESVLNTDQSEAANTKSVTPETICSSEKSQSKSPKKSANEKTKKCQIARKSNGESDSERRVTFGKRYTKKFTKTTTQIGVSVGTVKQQEIKSILKRRSDL